MLYNKLLHNYTGVVLFHNPLTEGNYFYENSVSSLSIQTRYIFLFHSSLIFFCLSHYTNTNLHQSTAVSLFDNLIINISFMCTLKLRILFFLKIKLVNFWTISLWWRCSVELGPSVESICLLLARELWVSYWLSLSWIVELFVPVTDL